MLARPGSRGSGGATSEERGPSEPERCGEAWRARAHTPSLRATEHEPHEMSPLQAQARPSGPAHPPARTGSAQGWSLWHRLNKFTATAQVKVTPGCSALVCHWRFISRPADENHISFGQRLCCFSWKRREPRSFSRRRLGDGLFGRLKDQN